MKKNIFTIFVTLLLGAHLSAVDFPKISGFKPETKVLTYNTENLYEYINGAADAYLAYGFKLLLSRDFSWQDLTFTVDIYDMGSRINAFGMYKTERPKSATDLGLGVEGVVSPPYQCLLLKGTYYVKVNAYEGEFDESSGYLVVKAIAAALEGSKALPEELELLPEENRVDESEGYNREAFLGISALNRCVYATYQKEDQTYRQFVVLPSEKEPVTKVWEKLSETWNTAELEGKPVLYKKIPYKGLAGVIQSEDKLLGASDCKDEDHLLAYLANFLNK